MGHPTVPLPRLGLVENGLDSRPPRVIGSTITFTNSHEVKFMGIANAIYEGSLARAVARTPRAGTAGSPSPAAELRGSPGGGRGSEPSDRARHAGERHGWDRRVGENPPSPGTQGGPGGQIRGEASRCPALVAGSTARCAPASSTHATATVSTDGCLAIPANMQEVCFDGYETPESCGPQQHHVRATARATVGRRQSEATNSARAIAPSWAPIVLPFRPSARNRSPMRRTCATPSRGLTRSRG